jgi:predicted MPP superfamily phosphohydrolase
LIESFGWLLLSDLHLKAGADPWAQHVVLREMRDDIRQQKLEPAPRFVLVSGDLAHGGGVDEYKQVETVFDAFRSELGLSRADFFLVPGNHDINRAVQKLCFAGARHQLRDSNAVDSFLGDPAEKESLLQRLSDYREFVCRYCDGQGRNVIEGDLGFVAPIDIEGFPISVVGLNSAWLCGREDDDRNILVGERTVIDVLKMLDQFSPRLVLGIFHHPPEWLQGFDRFALEQRMYPRCDIIHRGHLHEPGVRQVALLPGQACLMVAAGASYAGRQFKNSYAHIAIDLSRSICRVTTFIHDGGTFIKLPPVEFPVVGASCVGEISPARSCCNADSGRDARNGATFRHARIRARRSQGTQRRGLDGLWIAPRLFLAGPRRSLSSVR